MYIEELIEKIKADERLSDEIALDILKDIETLEIVSSEVNEYKEKYETLLKDYRNRFNEVEEVKEEVIEEVIEEKKDDEEIDIKEI